MLNDFFVVSIGFLILIVISLAIMLYLGKYYLSDGHNSRKLRKDFADLFQNIRKYDTVKISDLRMWYKDNSEGLESNTNSVIAVPNKKIIKNLGYTINYSFKDKKYLIQWINDKTTGTLLKISLISYNHIETFFQAKLIRNNDMIVIENN